MKHSLTISVLLAIAISTNTYAESITIKVINNVPNNKYCTAEQNSVSLFVPPNNQ